MISNSTRSGKLRINLSGEEAYASLVPAKLPPEPALSLDDELIKLLLEVREQLSYLNGVADSIPDVEIFLAMYVRKEALFSAQIEGTQATLDDILAPHLDINANRDVAEAVDNVNAVVFALRQIQEAGGLPLCLRLLRDTHRVLLKHSRGRDKLPGEFRTSQNWIGPAGCTLNTASYVPPNPEDMHTALYELEKFFHADSDLDPLIRAALIHYQFETIHPFLDGNGRIGRLLILLFLIEQKVICAPYLYISYFLKLNRKEYYDRMTAVREEGAYEAWLKFFLRAAGAAATDAGETIKKLQALGEISRQKICETVSGKVARERHLTFLSYLEKQPIVEIGRTAQALGWTFPTVSKFVKAFAAAGILKETTGRARGRLFAYEDYLALLRKDTAPL